MGTATNTTTASTVKKPDNAVGYIANLMALITGVLHLVAATNAIQFSQLLGILFVLNGLGFLGGAGLYLTNYWRSELFIVAAVYSVVTILELFVFQGWTVEAFYMQGNINPLAVITKAAEAVLAVCAIYLYAAE